MRESQSLEWLCRGLCDKTSQKNYNKHSAPVPIPAQILGSFVFIMENIRTLSKYTQCILSYCRVAHVGRIALVSSEIQFGNIIAKNYLCKI